ncbi:MAG: 1-acyl-sn-glycerol-3-phosphate acyltransferase, partial [uncultured Solirubrobacteraceae bacterium]
VPRRHGRLLADRAPLGPPRALRARAPPRDGAGARRHEPRLLLGSHLHRRRGARQAPDQGARQGGAVEDQGPEPHPRRDGPDPDRPRQAGHGRDGARDRGAPRRGVHRHLPRGDPQPRPRAAGAQRARAPGRRGAGRRDRLLLDDGDDRRPALPEAPADPDPLLPARGGRPPRGRGRHRAGRAPARGDPRRGADRRRGPPAQARRL